MKNELYGMFGVTAIGTAMSIATRRWIFIVAVVLGWLVFMIVISLEENERDRKSKKEQKKNNNDIPDIPLPTIPEPMVETPKITEFTTTVPVAEKRTTNPFDYSERNREDPESNLIDRFIFDNDPTLTENIAIDNPFSTSLENHYVEQDLFPELPAEEGTPIVASVDRIYNPSLNTMANEYYKMRHNEKNEKDYLHSRFAFTKSVMETKPQKNRDRYSQVVN